MKNRIWSMLLCAALVLTMAVPAAAEASEELTVVENLPTDSGEIELEESDLEASSEETLITYDMYEGTDVSGFSEELLSENEAADCTEYADAEEEPLLGAATSHTWAEAQKWLDSLLGKEYDYDGAAGTQCVDLALGYYNYLGYSTKGISGHAYQYATNKLPSGWTRVKGGVPKAGDILVYSATSDNQYGHVAIYAGGKTIYHGRYNHKGIVQKTTSLAYNAFPELFME